MPKPLTLRDAVHGDISLTALEVEVIDTPEFQRLRGIKQLGAAYLVYPTALHTRFEHSIGACHLAGRILEAVNANPNSERRVDPDEVQLIRLAALLHDISHVPFGHTFEDERKLWPRHDESGRAEYFVTDLQSSVAQVLERNRLRDAVYSLIRHGGEDADSPVSHLMPFARQVVSGTVCADLLDYLKRDVRFTGLRMDYDERIYRHFLVADGQLAVHLEKNGVLRDDLLSEVMNLLRLRYTLTERVYYHHTKAAAGAMLSRAVECAEGLQERDLWFMTDYELLASLRGRFRSDISARLAEAFLSRKLYKRAYVLGRDLARARGIQRKLVRRYHGAIAERAETERAIEERCGLPPGSVIIYCPDDTMSLKEAQVPVVLPGGEGPVAMNDRRANHPALDELQTLEDRYRHLWRFYVFMDPAYVDRRPQVAEVCAEVFGERSELSFPGG
ncbi:MAG: HD domain-containing protein [Armatimonadota bacterium]